MAAGFGSVEPAQALDQWASRVVDYSSQYNDSDFSAQQALGMPNTNEYGDLETAWAPASRNGTDEDITLEFNTPVYATSVLVRETWGNGFVTQIDLRDTNNQLHSVWMGTDDSQVGAPVNFEVTFTETEYLVKGVKIYVDTDHNADTWEEIDAVRLRGTPASACGAGMVMVLLAPMALPFMRHHHRLRRR